MSYSQGSVKTEYLDAISFIPNQRCSFELSATKMAYLPNLRLLNLGCDNATGAKDYNVGLGTVGLIRNIRLMDARTELSAMRNVSPYALFKHMTNTNEINQSIDSYYKRNQIGFNINGDDNKVKHIHNSGQSNTAASGLTTAGNIDLRELLPLLTRIPLLPTNVFKNLRLEIEFNSNVLQQILEDNNLVINILRPILAVDYVDEPKVAEPMMKLLMNGIQWNEIEWDNFQIPAQDTTGYGAGETNTQNTNNQSLGFRGKLIDKLLVTKQSVDLATELDTNAVRGFGAPASSQALLNEKFQVRLNGKNVFPGAGGVVAPNQMLGTLVDAYGDHQAYPGSNFYKWTNAAVVVDEEDLQGQCSWNCCEIGARVADLQLSITRTLNKDTSVRAPTIQALQVNMYAEVKKVLNFQNGSYSIIYA